MINASHSQSNQTENLYSSATIAAPPVAVATSGQLTQEAMNILEARGINLETALSLGLRSSKKNNAGEVVIEIPYLVNGEEVNCKTRTIKGEKRFFQRKDAQKVFYNHQAIEEWQSTPGSELLICEGELDCITAIQNGYLAISVPDGAPAQRVHDEESAKYEFLADFPKKGTVIICADGDDAGANLLHDLADRLGKQRCKWIKYPKQCKDLNDVVVKYGEKGIKVTLTRASWIQVDGVYRMSELPPAPSHDPMPCEVLPHNLRTGEMSVWTGIPGHGKSTLLNYISYLIASTDVRGESRVPSSVVYASFEQEPQTEHRYNLRTLYLNKIPEEASMDELLAADLWIDQRMAFIVPDIDKDEDADLSWLLEKMAVSASRFGTKLFIIDPWNELDHAFDRREMNATDYTGFAVKQLKRFAKRYRVHVAVIAHPAKLRKDRFGKIPIPDGQDIADSAHWFNKPDLGITVHRLSGLVLVKVWKSRYQKADKIGPTGDFWLGFNPETMRYWITVAPPPPEKKKKEEAKPKGKKKKEKEQSTLLDNDDPKTEEGDDNAEF